MSATMAYRPFADRKSVHITSEMLEPHNTRLYAACRTWQTTRNTDASTA